MDPAAPLLEEDDVIGANLRTALAVVLNEEPEPMETTTDLAERARRAGLEIRRKLG